MEKQKLSLDEIIEMANKALKWNRNCITIDGENGFKTIETIYYGESDGKDIWASKSKEIIPENVAIDYISIGDPSNVISPQIIYKAGAKQDDEVSEYQTTMFHPILNYRLGKLYDRLDKNLSEALIKSN